MCAVADAVAVCPEDLLPAINV